MNTTHQPRTGAAGLRPPVDPPVATGYAPFGDDDGDDSVLGRLRACVDVVVKGLDIEEFPSVEVYMWLIDHMIVEVIKASVASGEVALDNDPYAELGRELFIAKYKLRQLMSAKNRGPSAS